MWPGRSSGFSPKLGLDSHRSITAIDVASSFIWAQVHRTPRNPSARFASALVRRVARELAEAGWKLKAVTTDNGSEFRSLVPRYTALRRDLADYLGYYNFERAHTGRLSRGKTPGELVYGARKMRPR